MFTSFVLVMQIAYFLYAVHIQISSVDVRLYYHDLRGVRSKSNLMNSQKHKKAQKAFLFFNFLLQDLEKIKNEKYGLPVAYS